MDYTNMISVNCNQSRLSRGLSSNSGPHSSISGQSIMSQVPMDCSDMAQNPSSMINLESKVRDGPQSKLLGSKSLSKFVSQGIFFHRKSNKTVSSNGQEIMKTKSCTNELLDQRSRLDTGIIRQSSCNSFVRNSDTFFAMQKPNFSPIVGQPCIVNSDLSARPSGPSKTGIQSNHDEGGKSSSELTEAGQQADEEQKDDEDKRVKQKKLKKPYKPFKNTGLVLRDVRNSIGLRLRAKHDSNSFAKLTDNVASTPPTKLYSPFNIYTPEDDSKKTSGNPKQSKSKKAKNAQKTMAHGDGESLTPKNRVALQHKRHLTNKFSFDSPTGRVQAGVRDVERFQQCIEDISAAIKNRDSL